MISPRPHATRLRDMEQYRCSFSIQPARDAWGMLSPAEHEIWFGDKCWDRSLMTMGPPRDPKLINMPDRHLCEQLMRHRPALSSHRDCPVQGRSIRNSRENPKPQHMSSVYILTDSSYYIRKRCKKPVTYFHIFMTFRSCATSASKPILLYPSLRSIGIHWLQL